MSFSQDVVWLLCKRLVEIPSGYDGGKCLESQGIWRKWKQSLKVSLPWNRREWKDHGWAMAPERSQEMDWHLNIAWIQVLNGTGIMWMVSSLLNPKTTRAEGTWMEDTSLFCPSHIQSARFCNCVFRSLARRSGWCQRRQRPKMDWRSLQGILQTGASWQSAAASPTATCSNPLSPSAYRTPFGGLTSGMDWRKSPPSK